MFIDVGFSNFVDASKVISVSRPESSPIRRMRDTAKDEGRYIDLTQGKKTRSIITASGVMGHTGLVIIGSAVQTNTIIGRIRKAQGAITGPAVEVIGEGSSE